jgi:prophage antirepressor-like protein
MLKSQDCRAGKYLKCKKGEDFMSQLSQVFTYSGNQVRTIIKDGEVWFVAKDVCGVLNHSNQSASIETG